LGDGCQVFGAHLFGEQCDGEPLLVLLFHPFLILLWRNRVDVRSDAQLASPTVDRLADAGSRRCWQVDHNSQRESVMNHSLSNVQEHSAGFSEYAGESTGEPWMVLTGDAD